MRVKYHIEYAVEAEIPRIVRKDLPIVGYDGFDIRCIIGIVEIVLPDQKWYIIHSFVSVCPIE